MNAMTSGERRAVVSLASIFAMRMIGLFMIMPVIAVYGQHLDGYTPALVGLAVGIYGLMQAILQTPVGMLSDRMSRKWLIIGGLVIFALGGAVAALSTSIWGVIIGRAIQGAGAISGVVMALLADLTREEQRTKAMATIGMSIGASFAVAFVLGPLIAGHTGLSGLFWVTTAMALGGILICHWMVPQPLVSHRQNPGKGVVRLKSILLHPELARLNWGVFTLHLIMTASWVVVPALLIENGHLDLAHHGWVYLPVMFIAFIAVVPAIIVAEKRRKMRRMFVAAIMVLLLSLLWLAFLHDSLWHIVVGLFLYFVAFNLLEALLPSLVSKITPAGAKGTAMGVFSSAQFLGPFFGGVLGGLLVSRFPVSVVFLAASVLVLVWLGLAMTMAPPRYLHSLTMQFDELSRDEAEGLVDRLLAVSGVEEAVLLLEEHLVFLKVDKAALDEDALRAFPARAVAA